MRSESYLRRSTRSATTPKGGKLAETASVMEGSVPCWNGTLRGTRRAARACGTQAGGRARAATAEGRGNVDSLYGDRKKNAVGNTATDTTVVRAIRSEYSPAVKPYSAISAARNDRFDTSSAAESA